MTVSVTAPDVGADEDTLVLPTRTYAPRRGGRGPGFVAKLLDDAPALAAAIVAEGERVPRLGTVEIAPALLADPTGPAAAAVEVLRAGNACRWAFGPSESDVSTYRRYGLRPFLDAWVVRHGVEFAARVTMELAGMELRGVDGPPWDGPQGWTIGPTPPGGRPADAGHHDVYPLMARLRGLLARRSDAEYAAATACVAGYRDRSVLHRRIATYLVPTRTDWVEADLADLTADPTDVSLLSASISGIDQLDRIVAVCGDAAVRRQRWTVLDGVGPEAADRLVGWAVDRPELVTPLGDVLAVIPSDAATALLLDRVDDPETLPLALAAIERFPRRALRLLAARARPAGAGGRLVDELFRVHVLRHRTLVPTDPHDRIHRAAAVATTGSDRPTAPAPDTPTLLVTPPWSAPRPRRKPLVVAGLAPRSEVGVRWHPGERDEWREHRPPDWWDIERDDWAERAAAQAAGRLNSYEQSDFFLRAPDAHTAELFPQWRPASRWSVDPLLRPFAARYELAALPHVLTAAKRSPQHHAACLAPFVSAEIAALMADWATRTKGSRATARGWLHRHAEFAADALLPAAVGRAGRARRTAEAALRLLDVGIVTTAADARGPDTRRAVDAALAADPLYELPSTLPERPGWMDPALLPPVLLVGRRARLDPAAVDHLLTMFALSTPDEPYAGLAPTLAALDPPSLAAFAWAMFRRWQLAGWPPTDDWVLTALGWCGDDDVVRALSPMVRTWPGENASARATKALDVLAEIGTDAALMQLTSIAQRIRYPALRKHAVAKVEAVAARRDLTVDQLADRGVPDLGLDTDGRLTLDYGPRRFTVDFDEHLVPFVRGERGRRLARPPKPSGEDDPERAADAVRTFTTTKKDARAVAGVQLQRLEQAMVEQRTWSGAEFRTLLVGHPLLRHLVPRVIWIADGAGFRVAEDGSAADVDDAGRRVADDAEIRLAHPLYLPDRDRWGALFADYEILQPFPQLTRDTFAAADVTAKVGTTTAPSRLLGLDRRGWLRGPSGGSGPISHVTRHLTGGRAVFLTFSPGAEPWAGVDLDQRIDAVLVGRRGERPNGVEDLSVLDPITVSEIARDLTAALDD